MRDLTKNAFRFSWSLSLFGVQQMVNLLAPSRAAKAFDEASRAMERQLDGTLRETFERGSELQDRVAELTFGEGRTPLFRGTPEARPEPAPVPPGGASEISPPTAPSPADPPAGPAPGPPPTGVGSSPSPQPAAARTPGWGPIPYPVVPPSAGPPSAGPPSPGPPSDTAPSPTAPGGTPSEPISADYPFESRYLEVLGSRMHYVEMGQGDPILLLHGNPTWSYVWRNIMPHLAPLGRCIAPDLIGFGRSDKPDLDYQWADHVPYVEGFIEKMGLRNVRLVLHDQGSNLGLHYASRHASNVKALAFFEAILRPYPWDEFSTPEFRELFRRFRTGDVGGEGWQMIVEQNVFIEGLLPQAAGRPLSEKEMSFYREPFPTPESRIPIWRWPRQTPIGGEPEDVWQAVGEYSRWLQASELPKLLLYATPGALITPPQRQWAEANIRNLKTVDLGAGSHFLQESSPHAIGRSIAAWFQDLEGGSCHG